MHAPRTLLYLTDEPATPRRDPGLQRARGLARVLGVPVSLEAPAAALAHLREPEDALVVKRARPDERAVLAGRGPSDRSFLRTVPCSSWILAREGPPRSSVVVAAASLDDESGEHLDERVLRLATSVARAEGARLLVVHAWMLIGEPIVTCPVRGIGPARSRHVLARIRRDRKHRLEALVASCASDADVWTLVESGVAPTVLRKTLCRVGATCLVLGYRGRTGAWGWIRGNLAERFLGVPDLSILAVRPCRRPRPSDPMARQA